VLSLAVSFVSLSRVPGTEALLCFGLPTRGMEESLAASGARWHACLTIVGNRKLKIKSFFYNALGRVPSRAKAGSWQGRMRRAEQGHHHHIAGPYLLRYARGFVARRPSPSVEWRTGSHGFRTGDEARAVRGFLWILAMIYPLKIKMHWELSLFHNDLALCL
jgi:hypothetical protein